MTGRLLSYWDLLGSDADMHKLTLTIDLCGLIYGRVASFK